MKKTLHDIVSDALKKPLPIKTDYWSSKKSVFKTTTKPKKKLPKVINNTEPSNVRVFYRGDFIEKRIEMKNLGLDLGTRNIVLAFKEADGSNGYIRETNGYWPFERITPFIKNMLNDPNMMVKQYY